MKLEYGSEVIDRTGELLGTVDRLVRDLVTGDIRKFVVRRKGADRDLFIAPDDVSEATEDSVRLNVTLDELRLR